MERKERPMENGIEDTESEKMMVKERSERLAKEGFEWLVNEQFER